MPAVMQQQAGLLVGSTYPLPIVDHAKARERALLTYKQ
jgi:deoxyribodipyrimidine photo-lyase